MRGHAHKVGFEEHSPPFQGEPCKTEICTVGAVSDRAYFAILEKARGQRPRLQKRLGEFCKGLLGKEGNVAQNDCSGEGYGSHD